MSRFKIFALIAVIFSLLMVTASWAAPQDAASPSLTKQLAAPPSEFASLRMPDPAESGIHSRTAMIPVHLAEGKDGLWQWQGEIAVDDGRRLTLMLLSSPEDQWQLSLRNRSGELQFAPDAALPAGVHYERSQLAQGDFGYPADVYVWENGVDGRWQVTVSAQNPRFLNQDGADGYLIVAVETNYQLYAHLTSYNLLAGQEIGLNAFIYDNRFSARDGGRDGRPVPSVGLIREATLELRAPNGDVLSLPMTDNGAGQFAAAAPALVAGDYIAQVKVSGVTPEGRPFVRTSEHAFPVIAPAVSLLDQSVNGRFVDENRISLNLSAAVAASVGAGFDSAVRLSAELWGANAQGEMIPVVWLGGLTEAQSQRGQTYLPLNLDSRWISLAGARAPFELREVRVQDSQTHIPLAQLDRIALRLPRLPQHDVAALQTIPEEMLMGARPDVSMVSEAGVNNGGRLLLVHGYCSGGVWPTNHFSNHSVFLDANQNRTHDQFANLIRNHGAQFPSFGVVAHSQGGAASLHLYTYYWSGLDWSSGSRLIQSVGTPYQGTALAGSLALMGEVFGAGCGANWDLTYDGASLWLSGIPSWARNRVYYHTTSFTWVWWRYDYCHLATDMFLSDPEDGTTERWAGQLSGAHNMGHKTGWCHTNGMRDPAQYLDQSRNSNMNTHANR
jgi:hypothetical protein